MDEICDWSDLPKSQCARCLGQIDRFMEVIE